mmetsp:Transcript_26895/g.38143  ORF Transcript_26895/g.38143 Transcript_26895/m.38143 type:complete len:435 (+) Transcript_26895:354-1658(+)
MSEQSGGPASPDAAPSSNPGHENKRDRRNRNNNRNNNPRITTFIGDPSIEFLKGYVYDVGPKSKDQFSTTTERIGQYIQGNGSFKKGGGDFINAFNPNDLRFEDIPDPTVPEDTKDIVKIEIWKLQQKEAHARRNDRQDVINAAYSIVRKQCSEALWNRVESHKRYAIVQANMDVIELLKLIRNALYTGATTRNSCVSTQDALIKLFTFKQSKPMQNADYLKKFKELTELVAFHGTIIGIEDARVNEILKTVANNTNMPTPEEIQLAKDKAQEQFFAILLIQQADKVRFRQLIADLENSFIMGEDCYPKTITKAYEILVNYKKFTPQAHDPNEHGVSYYTPTNAESTQHNTNSNDSNNNTRDNRTQSGRGNQGSGRGGPGSGRGGRGGARGAGRGTGNGGRGARDGETHLLQQDDGANNAPNANNDNSNAPHTP